MAKLKDGTRIYGNANVDSTLTTLDLVVTGNLTIKGTTTTVDTTVSTVKDPLITLGANVTGDVPDDGHERGLILKYAPSGVETSAFLGWHTSNGEFALASNVVFNSATNEVTSINSYGNVHGFHFKGEGDTLGNITGANVTGTVLNANNSSYAVTVTGATQGNITSLGDLTGLTVDGISNLSAVNSNGIVNVTNSTSSTSSSDGALVVAGGAGIGGNLYVGGNIYGNFAGDVLAKGSNTYVQFNDDGNQNGVAGFTFSKSDGNLYVQGTANVGNLSTAGTVTATKTANVGNLVTPGFANIDKDLLVGTGALAANANVTGSLKVAATANVGNLVTPGIANIDGELHVGTSGAHANATITGNITVVDNYSSTNGNITLTNGNLTVGGHANITDTANVGNLTTGGNIDGTGASSTANVQYLTVRSTANVTGTANVGNLITPGYANINKDLLVGTAGLAANANITGSLTLGSFHGDFIPDENVTWSLGNSTHAWKDLWISGSSIKIGTQTISTTTGGVAISNNITANTLDVTGDSNIGNSAGGGNLNVNGNVIANGRITSNVLSSTGVVFSNATHALIDDATFTFDSGLLKVGNIELSGTANVANAKVRALTTNAIPYTNGSNTLTADSTFTFETATSLLKVGNATLSGTANAANVVVTSLSNSRITFANATSTLVDNANLTFDTAGNTLTTDNLGLRATANVGNVVLRSLANTQLSFANATNALVGSANLTFDTTSNTLSATNITGTLTAAASSQPNITSTGTLSSLVVSGNIQSNSHVITDNIETKSAGDLNISAPSGNVILLADHANGASIKVSGAKITGLAEPTIDTDAATKYYVDHVAQGLHVHGPAAVATTVNLASFTLSSPYEIDGYTLQNGDRVLVKDQTDQSENGIYDYNSTTHILSRSSDANVAADLAGGDFVFVINGSSYGDTGWVQTEVVTTLGTDDILWQQFSGAGSYTGGESYGIHLDGTIIKTKIDGSTIDYDGTGNLKVKDSLTLVTPNIGDATGSNLNLGTTGNLTAGNAIIGTGAGGSITGANLVSATYLQGTIVAASNAQPNITSLGTLTGLTVDGGTLSVANANLTIGTTGSAYGIKTDNYWYANGTAIDFQTAAGSAGEIQFKSSTGDNLNASANLSFDSGNSNLTVTGNILNATGAIISGNIQANNLTSTRVVFAGTNGKLIDSDNLTFSGTELGITGTANVSGNVKGGNIIASNLTDTRLVFSNSDHKLIDNANLTFSGTELSITGTANVSSTVKAGNLQSTALTSTRVAYASTNGLLVDSGNLTFSGTELGITGTANVSSTVKAGNLQSTALTSGRVALVGADGLLVDDGDLTFNGTELTANAANVVNEFTAGNVTSRALSSGHITFAGAGGLLTDSTNLSFNTGSNVLTLEGNIQLNGTTGVGSLTGNGSISMTGNITGANIDSGSGLIKTTGNVDANNVNATHFYGTLETASQGNITSLGTLTSLNVDGSSNLSAVGNVTITGGTAGQYLRATNSSGGLEYASIDASTMANGTSNVSIPTVNGNIIMVRGGTTVVTITGTGANVTGYIDATGNINGNNITAGNLIIANSTDDATSSITGAIKTPGGISAQGNIYTGHSIGFANNNGGTASKAYIQYNTTADSLDFIFN